MFDKLSQNYMLDFDYNDGYESFCFQGCISVLYELNNVKNFYSYLNSSLSLRYIKLNNNLSELIIEECSRDLLPSCRSLINREYPKEECSSDVLDKNLQLIEQNLSPIIIGVDTYYLPYTNFYKVQHAMHTAILCGQTSTNKYFIIDWYKPWFYKGEIERKDLLLARNSKNTDDGSMFSGTPILNNWATVNLPQPKRPIELFIETIKLSYLNYYKQNDDQGINALIKMKDDIANYWKNTQLIKLFFKGYLVFANKRKIFYKYIYNFINFNKDEIIEEKIKHLLKNLKEIILIDENIRLLALKLSMQANEKTALKLINHLDEVILLDEMNAVIFSDIYNLVI